MSEVIASKFRWAAVGIVCRACVLPVLLAGSIASAQFEVDDVGGFEEEATAKPKKEKVAREKKAKQPKVAREKGEKKPAAALIDLELTGKLEKKETERKGKKQVSYILAWDDGTTVKLPKTKVADLDALVGQRVSVSGKGTETEKKGKKVVSLKKITSIVGDAENVDMEPDVDMEPGDDIDAGEMEDEADDEWDQ